MNETVSKEREVGQILSWSRRGVGLASSGSAHYVNMLRWKPPLVSNSQQPCARRKKADGGRNRSRVMESRLTG